jgi:two-component system response regulator RpfG
LVSAIEIGIEVSTFASPLDALEWAESNQPDLILTDYKMPDMDGVELTRRLRGLPRCMDVPIVVITVVDETSVRYQALESGATDVMIKPVDHHECRARCRNLLTLRKQSQIIKTRARWLEKQVTETTRLLQTRERDAVQRLARGAEYREDPTGERFNRVSTFAGLIARKLKLSNEESTNIEFASMVHDVGKLAIPDSIVMKPGRLTPDEFEIMQTHTTEGYAMLSGASSPFLEVGAAVALSHHERFDGSGYPRGLVGEQIPLSARIVAVADVYDALTSQRPYATPLPMNRAVEFLNRQKGFSFDPQCIEAFNSQLDKVVSYDGQHQALQGVD